MSEALLIGGCLYDHRQLAVARRTVTGDMFASEAHRLLWQTLCRVADTGMVPDPPTVLEHLTATDLDVVGGAGRVHDLYAGVTASNVPHYAVQVATAHRQRKLEASCRQAIADLSDGADPDEVLSELTAATGHPTGRGSWSPSELSEDLARLLAGADETWSTGWPQVDQIWRPAPGTVTVVTGVPGSGKSTFLDPVLLHQVAADRKVAVWSPEQAPAAQHLSTLVWCWTGVDPHDLPRGEVDHVLSQWDGLLTMLDPSDTSLQSVLARAAGLEATAGLDVLVLDPWNKLAHQHGDQRHDLYLQAQLAKVTQFARTTGCAVWVVAHPTKLQRMTGTDTCWQAPTIYDISGGAEWANQADVVLAVWRDARGERRKATDVEVIVQKVRREQWGEVGRQGLRFDPRTRTYAALLEAA